MLRSFQCIFFGLLGVAISSGLLVESASAFAGGDGTPGDPYQIETWEDFHNIRNELGASYVLNNNLSSDTADFDLYASSATSSGAGWLPIGTIVAPFTGVLDGAGFTISDLYINRPTTIDIGVFGYVTTGDIIDIVFEDISVIGSQHTAGLIGRGTAYTISNVEFSGSIQNEYVDFSTAHAGGLVAYSVTGPATIENTTVRVDIKARKNGVGGLVGYANGLTVTNTHVESTITKIGNLNSAARYAGFISDIGTGTNITESSASTTIVLNSTGTGKNDIGGFVGTMQQNSSIARSFARGSILVQGGTGTYHGGFIGRFIQGTITNSYADVSIVSEGSAGAFMGATSGASAKVASSSYAIGNVTSTATSSGFIAEFGGSNYQFNNVFYDVESTGQSSSLAGIGTSTALMKTVSTFTNVGWDFSTVWGINISDPANNNKGYPFLRAQGLAHVPTTAPRLGTSTASTITQTSAQLSGEVTSAGALLITARGVEYGPTLAYGSVASTTGADLGIGSFSFEVTGLTCNTTYQYRHFATNDDGTTYKTGSFTTLACPAPASSSKGSTASRPRVMNVPVTTPDSAGAPVSTGASMTALRDLVRQYVPVLQQAQAAGIVLPEVLKTLLAELSTMPASTSGASGGTVRDLDVGMSGDDVRSLQTFLIKKGYSIEAGATGYFGSQTKTALMEYQEKNGITPAQGYFGSITRQHITATDSAAMWW